MKGFTRFSFPAQSITDNATYFKRKLFQDNCSAVGLKHKLTTTYRPQANITVRVNRNLKAMPISHSEQQKDRDAYLAEIAFATRTTVVRWTAFTPADLKYGREMPFALDRIVQEPEAGSGLLPQVVPLRQQLRYTVWAAREHLHVARLQHSEHDQ